MFGIDRHARWVPPGATLTLRNFDAQNRAIPPISMRGSVDSDILGGGGWGQMGQMGCPVDYARALED